MTREPYPLAALGLLALLVAIAFSGTLSNELVYDDREIVRDNPVLETLSPGEHLGRGFWPGEDRTYPYYRPLTSWTLALNHALNGETAPGYHLANLLLHFGCATLLFLLLRGLAGAWPGLAAAALFAVHPVQTEAVAWVVGRADLLATFFLLLTLLIHSGLSERVSGSGVVRVGAAAGTLAAALLSKENALTFPVLLIALELARAVRHEGSWRERLRPAARRLATAGAVYLVILVGYLLLRHQIVGSLLASGDEALWKNPILTAPLLTRWLTAVHIAGRYLLLIVFPRTLCVDYYYDVVPLIRSLGSPGFLVPAAAIAGLLAWVWIARRSTAVIFGALAAAGAYLPLSHLLFAAPVVMAERILYLPMVGVTACLGASIVTLATRIAPQRKSLAAAVLTLLVIVPLALRARDRTADWRNDLALFGAAVEAQPRSALSWNNLASIQLENDDAAAAEQSARRALEILPDYLAANGNLADALRRLGRFDESERVLRKALLESPEAEDALWLNLVQLITMRASRLEGEGRTDTAGVLRREAIDQARARLERVRTGIPAAVYHLALAQNFWALDRNEEAGKAFVDALVATETGASFDNSLLEVRITVYDATAAWHRHQGRADHAARSWLDAAAAAEAVGTPARAAAFLLRAAQVRLEQGDRAAALDLVRQAQPLGRGNAEIERRVRAALSGLQEGG